MSTKDKEIVEAEQGFLGLMKRYGIEKAYQLFHKGMESGKFDEIDGCSVCATPWGYPPFKSKPNAASTCLACTEKLWADHWTKDPTKPFLDPLRRTPYFMCVCGIPISTISGPCPTPHSLFSHVMGYQLGADGKPIKCEVKVEDFNKFRKEYGW